MFRNPNPLKAHLYLCHENVGNSKYKSSTELFNDTILSKEKQSNQRKFSNKKNEKTCLTDDISVNHKKNCKSTGDDLEKNFGTIGNKKTQNDDSNNLSGVNRFITKFSHLENIFKRKSHTFYPADYPMREPLYKIPRYSFIQKDYTNFFSSSRFCQHSCMPQLHCFKYLQNHYNPFLNQASTYQEQKEITNTEVRKIETPETSFNEQSFQSPISKPLYDARKTKDTCTLIKPTNSFIEVFPMTKVSTLTGQKSSNNNHENQERLQEELTSLPKFSYKNGPKTKHGYLCMFCGKWYSRKYGLKIHVRTHTGFKPLKCKVCQRPFGDPSNLNKHIRLHAEGETPYKCDLCGKVLVRKRDLERHMKSRHGDDKKDEIVTSSWSKEDSQDAITPT